MNIIILLTLFCCRAVAQDEVVAPIKAKCFKTNEKGVYRVFLENSSDKTILIRNYERAAAFAILQWKTYGFSQGIKMMMLKGKNEGFATYFGSFYIRGKMEQKLPSFVKLSMAEVKNRTIGQFERGKVSLKFVDSNKEKVK